jgi:hypothetical protein
MFKKFKGRRVLLYILNEFDIAGRASLQCSCTQEFVFADVYTGQNGIKEGDILSLFLFYLSF